MYLKVKDFTRYPLNFYSGKNFSILILAFAIPKGSNTNVKWVSVNFHLPLKISSSFLEKYYNLVFSFARLFDREKQSVHSFQVVATDSGRYDVRLSKVPVTIMIEDVNDNRPKFSRYPFFVDIPAYTQPGHDFFKVTAEDKDEGTNAEIVYRFSSESSSNKFHINPNTGSISAMSSLSIDVGKLYHLEVIATDKGNPPLSTSGLVEIRIGETPEGMPSIRFQNTSYVAHLPENSPAGKQVCQV